MNIFIFDNDINENVKMYCDKHVVKMILETAQLLSTAYRVLGSLDNNDARVYKLNHINHPCSIWTRTSYGNYKYLIDLYYALHDEWNYRYKHDKIHKSYDIIEVIENINPKLFKYQKLTEFCQCFPDQYKHESVTQGYRNYFINEKKNLFSWKNRPIPTWILPTT